MEKEKVTSSTGFIITIAFTGPGTTTLVSAFLDTSKGPSSQPFDGLVTNKTTKEKEIKLDRPTTA